MEQRSEHYSTSHATRESNLSNLEREKQPKLNLPSPNDRARWKELDGKLENIVPYKFSQTKIETQPVSKTSADFLKWLHGFLKVECGIMDPKAAPGKNRKKPKPPHKGLEKLRKKKLAFKKARKALIKNGLGDSEPMKTLTQQWRGTNREHKALRRAVQMQAKQREKRAAEAAFKKDPNKFAEKLFKGTAKTANPTFSKEEAMEYFAKTYKDTKRDHSYKPMPNMIRPGLPNEAFTMRPPTVHELTRSANRKRNGASPGLDAITYVVYKRCPSIILFIHLLCIKIWKECEVADDWALAFISLLSKSDILDVVSEFRPITMTATIGKIVLSVLSDRLQHFLVSNAYIPRKIQKGFLSGIAGCVEHSFMLFEALKEAKEETRQIVVTWIDLANAYGSVRHNLIQFALDWYHVPKRVQALIFNYYEKLMAKVVTKEWTTGFFLFDIGLFQGCVLSTILFLCVFQLLLDCLKPLQKKYGYKFKSLDVQSLAEAYADDLAIITKNSTGNQITCDATTDWLSWTETMAAKPVKCISLGLKQFDPRIKSEKFKPVNADVIYSPFDPKITIAGQTMNFILDFEKLKSDNKAVRFKSKHFKFLGRWIHFYLDEKDIKQKILDAFNEDVEKVSSSDVNGMMKMWLYEFGIIRRLTWPLLIHDLNLSFAKEMQTIIQPLLKKWSGIGRTVDEGLLYRLRQNLGLQITSVGDHYKASQLIKAQLLQNSADSNIGILWKAKQAREASLTRHFRVSKLNAEANAQTELELLFPTQSSRQGLGNGNFKAVRPKGEKRKLVTITARSFAEEKRVLHAQELGQQGAWIQWQHQIVPYDLTWKNLIYGPGPHVIKFLLNATVNWVKTPDTMKMWGYTKTALCVLCGAKQCTLHHIISNCAHSLQQKRYTWRHDSVLFYLKPVLQQAVDDANANPKQYAPPTQAFVKAGSKTKPKTKSQRRKSILDWATDWKLLVDFETEKIIFPPEIYSTPLRPDIIIWSSIAKQVFLIELTCPAEEGIEAAQIRKEARYAPLEAEIKSANRSWSVTVMTIEAGARGFVARTIPRCLNRLGLAPRQINRVCKAISTIVSRCTYTIYLARESQGWAQQALLTLSDDCPAASDDSKPAVIAAVVKTIAAATPKVPPSSPSEQEWKHDTSVPMKTMRGSVNRTISPSEQESKHDTPTNVKAMRSSGNSIISLADAFEAVSRDIRKTSQQDAELVADIEQ